MFLYSWINVPNFWLFSDIDIRNCLIPLTGTSFFYNKIFSGSFINSSVIVKTSLGIVAEIRQTWISLGSSANICTKAYWKPLIISSASSRIKSLRWSVWSHFFSSICHILPGVPIAMLTWPFCRACRSSLVLVPPTNNLTPSCRKEFKPTATS